MTLNVEEGMLMRSGRWGLVTALTAAALLSGCSSAGSGSGEATSSGGPTVVELGGIFELSGPLSAVGKPMENAVELAITDINGSAGVKIGDATYTFKLASNDLTSDPAVAVQKWRQAGADHKIIIGPVSSAPAIRIAEVAGQDPSHLTLGLTSSIFAQQRAAEPSDYPFMFMGVQQQPPIVACHVDFLKSKDGSLQNVALVFGDDAGSQSYVAMYKEAFAAQGISVTMDTLAAGGDALSVVRSAIAQNPGALVVGVLSTTNQAAIKAAVDLGYEGIIGAAPGAVAADASTATGGPVEGFNFPVNGTDLVNSTDPAVQAYVAALKSQAGIDVATAPGPWPASTVTYDYVHILIDAMKTAGSVNDVARISAAMNAAGSYDGLLSWKITEGGVPTYSADMYQTVDGKPTLTPCPNLPTAGTS